MDEDLLPYNNSTNIYRNDYTGITHKTRKVPDKQEYWEAPIIELPPTKRMTKMEEDITLIQETLKNKKEDEEIKETINNTIDGLDELKRQIKYLKYFSLILILILVYLTIILFLNVKI